MPALDREIEVFTRLRPQLEARHQGRWVLIHDDQFVGDYDSFSSAANEAMKRFGKGPYLIRKVGAPEVVLPRSALFVSSSHAD